MIALLVVAALAGFWLFASLAHSRSGGFRRGTAGGMDIVETMSPTAARRAALQVRPNTHTTRKTPVREVGREIGKAGFRRLVVTFQDIILIIAPVRTFKTQTAITYGRDAPGALLTTSTRNDLRDGIEPYRRLRPEWVLNPRRIGGVDNTLRWSPVFGCREPRRAIVTAAYFVSAGDSEQLSDASFWESQAVRAMRNLLAAADLAGADLHTVNRWRALDSQHPIDTLESHPDAPAGWAADLRELQALDVKQRGSIATTMATCLQFLADPQLAAIATPTRAEHFDIDRYLRLGGAVHVIGRHEKQTPVGPLFAALAGQVYERTRELGAQRRGRRMDPPLSILNDEAASTLRVPLPHWSADASGAGIAITILIQGRDQLTEAWGEHGAAAIWQNATTKIIGGGTSDPALLRDLSELCGTRATEYGAQTRRPVLLPDEIRTLPPGDALVLTRNCRPVIAHVRVAWQCRNPPIAQPLVAEEPQDAPNVVRLADHQRKTA